MSSLKKNKWDTLYGSSGYHYGMAPIHALRKQWQRLRTGKALDLAMGEGRNAVFLAEKGFEVQGFDISPVAIEKSKKLAYDKNVKISAKVIDLDLYVFPLMEFDTIILSYFKPISRFYSEIARSLVQGGTLLVESYTTSQLLQEPIKEFDNRDYFFPNELLKNLKGLQVFYYNEEKLDGCSVVQCLAKKPMDKDAVKYGFATDRGDLKGHYRSAEDLFKKK